MKISKKYQKRLDIYLSNIIDHQCYTHNEKMRNARELYILKITPEMLEHDIKEFIEYDRHGKSLSNDIFTGISNIYYNSMRMIDITIGEWIETAMNCNIYGCYWKTQIADLIEDSEIQNEIIEWFIIKLCGKTGTKKEVALDVYNFMLTVIPNNVIAYSRMIQYEKEYIDKCFEERTKAMKLVDEYIVEKGFFGFIKMDCEDKDC